MLLISVYYIVLLSCYAHAHALSFTYMLLIKSNVPYFGYISSLRKNRLRTRKNTSFRYQQTQRRSWVILNSQESWYWEFIILQRKCCLEHDLGLWSLIQHHSKEEYQIVVQLCLEIDRKCRLKNAIELYGLIIHKHYNIKCKAI